MLQTKNLVPSGVFLLLLFSSLPFAHAEAVYSIPINGRPSNFTIGLRIPSSPRWAHDVVLNATRAWNVAQIWFHQVLNGHGRVYTFILSEAGEVVVNFNIPARYSSFAVGWTDYAFAVSSKVIVSARVFLDHDIFNSTRNDDAAQTQYAFRIALHELGRVLGLGSILDERDIMDPRKSDYATTKQPLLSTLDLYALHVLASGDVVPSSVTLPATIPYALVNPSALLTPNMTQEKTPTPTIESSQSTTAPVAPHIVVATYQSSDMLILAALIARLREPVSEHADNLTLRSLWT